MSEPTKRTISPELREKMIAGRRAAIARRAAEPEPQRRIRNPQQPRRTQAASGEIVRLDTGTAAHPGPFRFPRPDTATVAKGPRLVLLAEVKDLTEHYWPLLQRRFPAARMEYIRPQLALATRGERTRLYRTDGGLALFELRETPWEPFAVVTARFVVGHDCEALIDAGIAYARQMRALRFECDCVPLAGATEGTVWHLDLTEERQALSF